MKKFFRILLWILVAAVFIGTIVYLIYKARPAEVSYSVVTPSIGTIDKTTVLTGQIEPRDEIAIKPQISGIISEILVEPGDIVKEGDVIAKIKVIPDASSLSSAQGRVNTANIRLNDARIKHERNTELYEKKIISREEYEQTLTSLNEVKEELAAATDALDIVKNGVSRYNSGEGNTFVRATINGLILDVPVKVGSSVIQANTLNDGTTVATIADMTNLIFKGSVDETEVGKLKVNMPISISIGALPDFKSESVIEYISPKGSNASGANTFEVKAALPYDSSVSLRSGYSANASVSLEKAENIIMIPESVVEFSGDSTFVYIMTDSLPKQVFRRHPIKTGIGDGINVEVCDGVDSTDKLRGNIINDK